MNIKKSFSNIDKLLENLKETKSEEIMLNIESNFYKISSLIEDIEESSVQFKIFKYSYHSKQAVFLHLIGKEDEAKKQEEKAKKFDQSISNSPNELINIDPIETNVEDFEKKVNKILEFLDSSNQIDTSVFKEPVNI